MARLLPNWPLQGALAACAAASIWCLCSVFLVSACVRAHADNLDAGLGEQRAGHASALLRDKYLKLALQHGAFYAGRRLLEPHQCAHDKLAAAAANEPGAVPLSAQQVARRAFSPQAYVQRQHTLSEADSSPSLRQDGGSGAAASAAAADMGSSSSSSTSSSAHVDARDVHESALRNIRIHVDYRYWGADNDTLRTCGSVGQYVSVGTPAPNTICSDVIEDNCMLLCTEDHVFTAEKGNFLQHVVIAEAVEWLSNALRVMRTTGPLTVSPGQCGFQGGVPIPASYTTGNVGVDADMVLLATARPTSSNVIAFAGSCKDDQFGRPVMGHMNFGPNQISLAIEDYAMQVGVATHEISHALGFQASKMASFKLSLNSTVTRNPLGSLALSSLVASTRQAVTSTRTRAVAQAHFGCTSAALTGAEIEDSGGAGTAGSHWEKRTFNDEFMTGTSSPYPVRSAFSLALFEDSGWYKPDYNMAERLDWGRGQGCAFALGDCGSWTELPGFGYDCSSDGTESCLYNLRARGVCQIDLFDTDLPPAYQHFADPKKGGFNMLSDYCPLVRPYSNGVCAYSSSATSSSDKYGEGFHQSSLCYDSSLLTRDLSASSTVRQACYRSLCLSPTLLRARLGLTWRDCVNAGDIIEAPGFHGSAKCPNVTFVCAGMPDILSTIVWPTFGSVEPNSVSGNGGDRVTITGTSFFAGMIVYVGRKLCTDIQVNATDRLTCVVSPHKELGEDTRESVHVFNTDEQGSTGENVILIRAASQGFVARAKALLRKLNEFINQHGYWLIPLVGLLCAGCLLAKVCSGKKKPNKVAPAAERYQASPHAYPRRPMHGGR